MIRFGQDVCGNLEAALRREWARDQRSLRLRLLYHQRDQYPALSRSTGRARAPLIAVVIHTVDVAMSVFGLKLHSHRHTMNVPSFCHLSERTESHA
jgi:hypothetical protein